MNRPMMCICLIAAAGSPGLVHSQEKKPNFSGRWQLNLSRSKIPKLDPPGYKCCYPKSWVVVIDHKEPNLTITIDAVEVDYQGKEHPFKEYGFTGLQVQHWGLKLS
jgi:hypothetical protein